MSERFFREIFFKSGGVSKLRMEDAPRPRHSEPRVPRTCLSKHRCLRTSSRPRRYAVAPPPSVRSSPRAGRPTLREIFEATPDWASYKRGMRSPRTPRARASRLDRALTCPLDQTHRPSRLRRDTSTSGARRWYVSRARASREAWNKTPSRETRAHGSSSPPGWHCARGNAPNARFAKKKKLDALRLTAASLPPSPQDTVTSMIIPVGFAAAGITLLVKGIDDLSWGKNRKEGF